MSHFTEESSEPECRGGPGDKDMEGRKGGAGEREGAAKIFYA